jgi:polar amino acid transport system substrate-binding protein
MITSVIVFASLTAALTWQYTLKHLRGPVNGKADLQYARMGAIAGTETTEYLGRQHITYQAFANNAFSLKVIRRFRRV